MRFVVDELAVLFRVRSDGGPSRRVSSTALRSAMDRVGAGARKASPRGLVRASRLDRVGRSERSGVRDARLRSEKRRRAGKKTDPGEDDCSVWEGRGRGGGGSGDARARGVRAGDIRAIEERPTRDGSRHERRDAHPEAPRRGRGGRGRQATTAALASDAPSGATRHRQAPSRRRRGRRPLAAPETPAGSNPPSIGAPLERLRAGRRAGPRRLPPPPRGRSPGPRPRSASSTAPRAFLPDAAAPRRGPPRAASSPSSSGIPTTRSSDAAALSPCGAWARHGGAHHPVREIPPRCAIWA